MFPSSSSVTTFPFLENLSSSLLSTSIDVNANSMVVNNNMAEENIAVSLLPGGTPNFTDYQNVPLLCDLTSMADNCLTSSNMFYLAFLSLHLFCRQPNPPALSPNIKTLKV